MWYRILRFIGDVCYHLIRQLTERTIKLNRISHFVRRISCESRIAPPEADQPSSRNRLRASLEVRLVVDMTCGTCAHARAELRACAICKSTGCEHCRPKLGNHGYVCASCAKVLAVAGGRKIRKQAAKAAQSIQTTLVGARERRQTVVTN